MRLSKIHQRVNLRRQQRGFFCFGGGVSSSGITGNERSVRLRASASPSLSLTPGSAGNRKLLSKRFCVRRCRDGTLEVVASAGTSNIDRFYFDANAKLCLDVLGTQRLVTSQAFRDLSNFSIIGFDLDVANGTAANRAKILVNDVEVSSYSTDGRASITNTDTNWNDTVVQYYGRDNAGNYMDGYLTQVASVDGSTIITYSETDANSIVVPKGTPSATWGTNGHLLTFRDTTSTTTLGYDTSGNGNHFTASGISLASGVTYDSMFDCPVNGSAANRIGCYATLNPLIPSAANISYANLRSGTTAVQATLDANVGVGIRWEVTAGASAVTAGTISASGATNTTTVTANKVFAFRVTAAGNLDYRNVTDAGAWTSITTGLSGSQFPYGAGAAADWNFGQMPFVGNDTEKALCTTNLPTPVILDPSQHHYVKAVAKSGDTSFTLPWNADTYDTLFHVKRRDAAGDWYVIDGLRGYSQILIQNGTAAETTDANVLGVSGTTITLKSTLADGSYIVEAWKAGPSASRSTNTSGTITSTVSANTTSGFSIVTYTGTGANATVGHGLGDAPKFLVVRNRNQSGGYNWAAWHTSLTSAVYKIHLNSTSAQISDATAWNSTAPTSSVFSVGTYYDTNYSAAYTYVAYCHAEVEGYSKFGNSTVSQAFIFAPSLPSSCLFKDATTTNPWLYYDTTRNPYNASLNTLRETDAVEGQYAANGIDINANGVKVRTTDAALGSSNVIHCLWADEPLALNPRAR